MVVDIGRGCMDEEERHPLYRHAGTHAVAQLFARRFVFPLLESGFCFIPTKLHGVALLTQFRYKHSKKKWLWIGDLCECVDDV